jgi:enamine deaminase RidA (YjgF/YER057c/UK114 family)
MIRHPSRLGEGAVDGRPASMLFIIPQLVRPEFLVEIELVAAKA